MVTEKDYPYDIAISYAGEDRDHAHALAEALRTHNVKVFYDRYEKTTLWGKNLYDYLSDLYQNQARYCVMLLSEHYVQKVWTSHEREAAQIRAVQEHTEYMLPIRLDTTELPGHLKTLVYLNWHEETIETITQTIIEKLGKSTQQAIAPTLRNLSPPQTTISATAQKTKEEWLKDGNVLSYLKRFLEALAAYEKALHLDPNFVLAWSYKGNALMQLERFEEAVAAYEQALRLDPNYTEAWNDKGNALWGLKRFEEAVAAYEQALRLDPNHAISWYNKGITLHRLGKSNEARQAYHRAYELGFRRGRVKWWTSSVINRLMRMTT